MVILGAVNALLHADPLAASNSGGNGIVRMLTVLLMAYAILRHQLFDIDVKLRWTIHRGTLVAVFIGIFLVATELAQNFFSESYGWAAGGIAAGLMLFALTPLQNFAERVAGVAVPGVPTAGRNASDSNKHEAYRSALRLAWSDGQLSAQEAEHLRALRSALALPPEDYDQLEREAIAAGNGPS